MITAGRKKQNQNEDLHNVNLRGSGTVVSAAAEESSFHEGAESHEELPHAALASSGSIFLILDLI